MHPWRTLLSARLRTMAASSSAVWSAGVRRAEWWNAVSAQDVAEIHQTARAREPVDEELAQAAQHMCDEVRDPYGVDTVRGGDGSGARQGLS